jgi:hypothetical protein
LYGLAQPGQLDVAADERAEPKGEVAGKGVKGSQSREVPGPYLEHPLGRREIPQLVLTQVNQLGPIEQAGGHRHLPAMAQGHQSGCSVDGRAEIITSPLLGLSGMQSHAHADRGAIRPHLRSQRHLSLGRSRSRVAGP